MEAVVCTINSIDKEIKWGDVRMMIAKQDFIGNVINFNTEALPLRVKKYILAKYINAPEWDVDKINYSSKAAGPLAMWVSS